MTPLIRIGGIAMDGADQSKVAGESHEPSIGGLGPGSEPVNAELQQGFRSR